MNSASYSMRLWSLNWNWMSWPSTKNLDDSISLFPNLFRNWSISQQCSVMNVVSLWFGQRLTKLSFEKLSIERTWKGNVWIWRSESTKVKCQQSKGARFKKFLDCVVFLTLLQRATTGGDTLAHFQKKLKAGL